MTEQPPSIYEINDTNALIEKREAVEPASDTQRAARAAETTYIGKETADEREVSLEAARDTVMAQFENEFKSPAEDGGEHQMSLTEVKLEASSATPEVTPVSQSEDETNSAVMAAEAYLRTLQGGAPENIAPAASRETENEPSLSIVERVHNRVEHARGVIGNVEKKITSTLGQAEHILRQAEGYLDEFQDKNRNSFQMKALSMEGNVDKIRLFVRMAADATGETHAAISAGARAIDTPLRLLETITERPDEDVETRELATQSISDLQELKAASPTSLRHEDLADVDDNLRELQRPKLSREEMLGLVQRTLNIVAAYNQNRQEAEGSDSPKMAKLRHIAYGLDAYMKTRR